MLGLENKRVLVLGLGGRGRAACELLVRLGAKPTAADSADNPELRRTADGLRSAGIEVTLGASEAPSSDFDFAVISPAVASNSHLAQSVLDRGLSLISELELAFQQAKCLSIAIAGTNGKGTTAELLGSAFTASGRKTVICGHRARPACSVADQTKDLDFLILQVNAFQLERTQFFRPAVGVLLNLAPDHLDRYTTANDYTRANGRLFQNQQTFDWAIVQSQALERLRELSLPVPARTITISATDNAADLHMDRGLLLSRLPNWEGPLLDMDHCRLRGPHNAENLLAALAVGHVSRLPLEAMVEPLKAYSAGPHRFERVAEISGVEYINDSKATNVDALQKALSAARSGEGGQPNVWLIAGGRDKGLEFHDVGPLLAKRVKRVFLIGEAKEKIRSAWSLFVQCDLCESLTEAVDEAAKQAVSGDVVLLSPACSSFDQFRDYRERGETFCRAVNKHINQPNDSTRPSQ